MKKRIFSLLIVLGLFIITGCKDKYDSIKGTWKATLENQNIYNIGDETVGGKEEYSLKCDGKGHYDLTAKSGDLANASYTIKDNVVTFYDEGREILAICKINDNKLDCLEKSNYAFKYIKVEK